MTGLSFQNVGGDNIGASPLANGLFFEEPITIATNLMHVDFGSVGNHEFDEGCAELLRLQTGRRRPAPGCTAAPPRLPPGPTPHLPPPPGGSAGGSGVGAR